MLPGDLPEFLFRGEVLRDGLHGAGIKIAGGTAEGTEGRTEKEVSETRLRRLREIPGLPEHLPGGNRHRKASREFQCGVSVEAIIRKIESRLKKILRASPSE